MFGLYNMGAPLQSQWGKQEGNTGIQVSIIDRHYVCPETGKKRIKSKSFTLPAESVEEVYDDIVRFYNHKQHHEQREYFVELAKNGKKKIR